MVLAADAPRFGTRSPARANDNRMCYSVPVTP